VDGVSSHLFISGKYADIIKISPQVSGWWNNAAHESNVMLVTESWNTKPVSVFHFYYEFPSCDTTRVQ